ncbi:MAG: beta strand repeat-containing protein [Minisyncoccota bacterium]
MSKLINKVSISVVSLATVLSLSGVASLVPATVHGATAEELQAQIALLMAQITAMQAQLSASGTAAVSSTVPASLLSSSDLTVGSKGAAVKALQQFLNANGFVVAASGAGSVGNETEYFGNATKAALAKMQAAQGISPAAGYFGAKTRAKLATMSSAVSTGTGSVSTGTGTVVTGSGMSVTLGTQSSSTVAPKNASRVPFTVITLVAGSSDVTVNSITVERTGIAQNAAFDGVGLVDETGMQIGISKTLNSLNQASVGDPFVVKAGQSKTVTVIGNMAASLASYDGQVASLKVVSVNTANNAAVAGLPLTGASLRLVENMTLGTATVAVSSYDPNSALSKEIGTTDLKLAGIRVTAGSAERVKLMSVKFYQSGSSGSSDLANVKVVVDGTSYATTVSTDGKYYSAVFGNGLLIDKGLSKDLYIQGDIVGTSASSRTIKFDISKRTDLYMVGETYGYGIIAPIGSGTAATNSSEFTAGTPWFDGSTVTITGGSATSITKSSTVAAQNIAVNVPDQVLGGFDTDMKGEPISVQQMVFHIATSSGSGAGLLTNVSLFDKNGAVIAGPVDAVRESDTIQKVTFSDTVTLPIGKSTFTLKGKVASTVGNGTQFITSTNPSSDWTNMTGQTTGNTVTLTNGNFAMNAMTVKAAALAFYASSNLANQTIVSGINGVTFANYQLDASQSGEDVRLSSIKLSLAASGTPSHLTNCQLFDGVTALNTGSGVINVVGDTSAAGQTATSTVTFDSALVVAKGTVKTLAWKCNISALAVSQDNFAWRVTATGNADATGVTSGNTVSPIGALSTSGTFTIGSASLALAADAASPSYTVVQAGSTGVVIGLAKLTATNEDMNVNEIALSLANTASSSSADLVGGVSIYDGSTLVGSVSFSGASTLASTSVTGLKVTKNTDKVLTVKADLASINADSNAHQGALITANMTTVKATGADSGNTKYSTGSATFSGVRMFKAVPTFAKIELNSSEKLLSSGTSTLYKFSVSAPAGTNGIGLKQFAINVATSSDNAVSGSTTVTNLEVYAYSNSSFSTPITTNSSTGLVNATDAALSGDNTESLPTIIQVGAGTTAYFKVVGLVTLANGTGTFANNSITTYLAADAAYPSLSGLMGYAADGTIAASKLVWSPNATTTSSATHLDWINGYLLPGLSGDTGLMSSRVSQ